MKPAPTAHLTPADLAPFESRYLHEGRKHESWRLEAMDIADRQATARVSMASTYVSPSDARGFHLTIFSTLEFLSEMMLIYAHVWAGLKEKTREGWMVESSTRSVQAIRDPERIEVAMVVKSIRQHGGTIFCIAEYRVTDRFGGLFEVRLKGFLS
jgi:hypothetical protein